MIARRRAIEPSLHRFGVVLIVAGLGLLSWAVIVYVWEDPFTAIGNRPAQRALGLQLEVRADAYRTRPQAQSAGARSLNRLAANFRRGITRSSAVGRLTIPGLKTIPSLNLRVFVVYGADTARLKRWPRFFAHGARHG